MLRKSGTSSLSGSVRLILLLDSEHAQRLLFHDTKIQPAVNKRHAIVSRCACVHACGKEARRQKRVTQPFHAVIIQFHQRLALLQTSGGQIRILS